MKASDYDSLEAYGMYKRNWIDKLITHNRDVVGDFGSRAVLHIPVGIVMSIPILGWGLIALFIYYEKNEDKWVQDVAFKDVYGALVGYVLGMITLIGVVLWNLL